MLQLHYVPFFTDLSPSNWSSSFLVSVRTASKKAGGNTRNAGNARRKVRGPKAKDGEFVQKGKILVLQNQLLFHPGLNVSSCCVLVLYLQRHLT